MLQPSLRFIFVFRRSYGRRYSDLPVDELSQEGFTIICVGALRPAHFDLQPGDIVRWRSDGVFFEGTLATVQRDAERLHATFAVVHPLPDDYFPY